MGQIRFSSRTPKSSTIEENKHQLSLIQKQVWKAYPEDSLLAPINFRMDKRFVDQLDTLTALRKDLNRTETIKNIVADSFNTQFIQEVSKATVPIFKEIIPDIKLKSVTLGNPLSRDQDEEILLTFNYQTTQLFFMIPGLYDYVCKNKFYSSSMQNISVTLEMNNPVEINAEIRIPTLLAGPEIDPFLLQKVFTIAAANGLSVQSRSLMSTPATNSKKEGKDEPYLMFHLSNRFSFNPCSDTWGTKFKNECSKFKKFIDQFIKILNTDKQMIKIEEKAFPPKILLKRINDYFQRSISNHKK